MPFRLSGAGLLLVLSCLSLAQGSPAKEETKTPSPLLIESYIKPPAVIEEAVRAPWQQNANVANIDPTKEKWLRVLGTTLPPLAWMAQPSLNLAGVQVDLKRGAPRAWVCRPNLSLTVRSLSTMGETPILVPKGVAPHQPAWSPDGKKIAFAGVEEDGVYLYVADAVTGKVKRISDRKLNPLLEASLEWKSDSEAVALVLAPKGRGAAPLIPVATSPSVRVTDSASSRLYTYPSRLENIDEAAQLRFFAMGQAAVIHLDGKVVEIGRPALIESLDASPGLDAFRVTLVVEPFFYVYPFDGFMKRTVIWDGEGKELAELAKARKPDEEPPSRAGERRSLAWDPFGRGLVFLQKQTPPKEDKGDKPKDEKPVKLRDRIMLWKQPFAQDGAEELFSSESDISSFILLPDQKSALITQNAGPEATVSLAALGGSTLRKLYSAKTGDFYAQIGSPVTKAGPLAGSVLQTASDGSSFYLSGTQYSREYDKEAPRPFLDQVSLADGSKTRIWQSRKEAFETARLLDDDAKALLITRQNSETPANDSRLDRAAGTEVQLTANEDRLPQITRLKKERVLVTRADGFKFWVEVTLPKFALNGEGKKAFFWFYPGETRSQASYDEGKRTRNINAFRRYGASSPQLLALLDYVVVEPDLPIVGSADRPNDTYVHQLRSSLYAIIDELDRRKLIDRRYLAIGGHSYGAFSTANAMVNTPFFKAGIAGDGNFNRTLTPFGFQAEPRRLWEGREVYLDMSPILKADQITGALLMYHGAMDQNVGTFPINSYRMFDALESLGKKAALYVYPYEDHGQIAMETRLDLWARWIAWLDDCLK